LQARITKRWTNKTTPKEIIFKSSFSSETEILNYSESLTEYAPIREGYTQDGRYSDTALTKTYSFTTMPAGNITLYAKWIKN